MSPKISAGSRLLQQPNRGFDCRRTQVVLDWNEELKHLAPTK
jgi:hypothetical protein